jgi:hypothetical protein
MLHRRSRIVSSGQLIGFLGAAAFALLGCGGGGGSGGGGSGGGSGSGSGGKAMDGAVSEGGGGGSSADAANNPDQPAADDAASGGASGSGGKAGSGGTTGSDASGSGGSAATDAGADMRPPICQAGEACMGSYTCDSSRCLRGEREECHCVNNSLFCGPVACTVDGGASDGSSGDAGIPACPANTSSGDDCNPASDRTCDLGCTNNRLRECFCTRGGSWICANTGRC